MQAVLVSHFGGPESMRLQELPDPHPTAQEVLVRVAAAGVNFADTLQTRGLYPGGPRPPYTPGLEFAGTLATGERVMGLAPQGAYAGKITVNRNALLPAPPDWSMEEAAAFPVNFFTAYFAYELAGLLDSSRGRGARVLIHAAAGGVGTAAVEIGKLIGVQTFGTTSSQDKIVRLKQLGLDHAIDYRTQDYEQAVRELTSGEGVDAVFEMLGGEHTAKSTRCLRPNGRLIVYGTATGALPQFDFMAMFSRNASVHALWLSPLMAQRERVAAAWNALSAWIAGGHLRPVVGHTLPLARAADAHRLLLERKNFGKVVLTTA